MQHARGCGSRRRGRCTHACMTDDSNVYTTCTSTNDRQEGGREGGREVCAICLSLSLEQVLAVRGQGAGGRRAGGVCQLRRWQTSTASASALRPCRSPPLVL